jgi:hypothetical protein
LRRLVDAWPKVEREWIGRVSYYSRQVRGGWWRRCERRDGREDFLGTP